MNEHRRAQYLDALGIDSFVPRYVLPAALPPKLCELPAGNEPSSARPQREDQAQQVGKVAGVSGVTDARPQAVVSIANILATSDSSEPSLEPKITSSSVLDASASDALAPLLSDIKASVSTLPSARFSLALWRVGQVQIIDARRPGEALPIHALLTNMLKAQGLLSTALPREEILNWPLVKNGSDSSWAAARQMVEAFLEGHLQAHPISQFLLFGRDAYLAVLGAEPAFVERLYTRVNLAAFDAEALVMPSLTDILYRPELKRAVWVAMQQQPSSAPL